MKQAIYTVTQESEWDGITGFAVFASKDGAVAYVNEAITECNDEEGSRFNPIMWPERVGEFRAEFGGYTYHLATDYLRE
jgi:hypothetical protein